MGDARCKLRKKLSMCENGQLTQSKLKTTLQKYTYFLSLNGHSFRQEVDKELNSKECLFKIPQNKRNLRS